MSISNSDTAAYVKIIAKRGDTFSRVFQFTNSDGSEKDLTGYTFRMQVRDSNKSNRILLDFTMTNGISVSGGAVTFQKAKSTMEKVIPGCHEYDIEVIKPDNTGKTWFYGPFEYGNDTTRATR